MIMTSTRWGDMKYWCPQGKRVWVELSQRWAECTGGGRLLFGGLGEFVPLLGSGWSI